MVHKVKLNFLTQIILIIILKHFIGTCFNLKLVLFLVVIRRIGRYLLFLSRAALLFLMMTDLCGFFTRLRTSDRLILTGCGFSVTSMTTLAATDAQSTSLASLPREIPRSSSLEWEIFKCTYILVLTRI